MRELIIKDYTNTLNGLNRATECLKSKQELLPKFEALSDNELRAKL